MRSGLLGGLCSAARGARLARVEALKAVPKRPLCVRSIAQCAARPKCRPRPVWSSRAPSQLRSTAPFTTTTPRPLFNFGVITNYVDLPPDYQDHRGLSFRRRDQDLDPAEITKIFGKGMPPSSANQLLRILHGRRVAGTLDDPSLRGNTAKFRKSDIDKALAYLRKTVPVEEIQNAGLRAEDELAAIEEAEEEAEAEEAEAAEAEREASAEDEKSEDQKRKDARRKETEASRKFRSRLFKDLPEDNPYGVGAFDSIRAKNQIKFEEKERRRLAEEARRQAEQEREWLAKGGTKHLQREGEKGGGVAAPGPTGLAVPGSRGGPGTGLAMHEPSPRMKKWLVEATSTLQEPPTMTYSQRLWPSYVFVFSLMLGGTVLASWEERREEEQTVAKSGDAASSWNDMVPEWGDASKTIFAILAANAAVLVLWRVPPLWKFMNRYMIIVPATPQPASMLGAMFSHQTVSHLLVNSTFLFVFGMRLHEEVGRTRFLEVFLSSGSLAFVASLTNLVLRNNLHMSTLGASGAIYGVMTAYFMMHKFEGFKILELPPDPYNGIQGLGFIGLMIAMNLLGMRAEKQTTDVLSHFAGMAVGAAYGQCFSIQRNEEAQAKAEGREPRRLLQILFDKMSSRGEGVDKGVKSESERREERK